MSADVSYRAQTLCTVALTSDTDWQAVDIPFWAHQGEIQYPDITENTPAAAYITLEQPSSLTYTTAQNQYQIPKSGSFNHNVFDPLQTTPRPTQAWIHVPGGQSAGSKVNISWRSAVGR